VKTAWHLVAPIIATLLVTGCSRNPNVEIVGSYFPGWMISLAVGVVLTVVAHTLLRKRGMERAIGQPVLIYPGMVIVLTCALWLLCFA
jgi:uncharacterized membrane protein